MKTYIEINAAHLVHNLSEFRKLTHEQKIMFVVKGNAYGHGLKEIVSITRALSFIHYYAVDSVEEALIVHAVDPDKKILIIGWADSDQIKEIILNHFEMVVPSIEYLEEVNALAGQLKQKALVHLKVETGTSRMGMRPTEIVDIVKGSLHPSNPEYPEHVLMVGLYSHFANIEDTTDHSYAQQQLTVFTQLVEQLMPEGERLLKHFSCSASALLFPKTYFDIVRVGISAYGFWPSKPTYVSYIEKGNTPIKLKPVLSWYSRVAQVKTVEKGESVGYGLTYRAFGRSKIIVVPVGYYDGYDRKLSGAATIIVNGVNAPLRGRICMNMFMADVTHIDNVKQGDPVVLIGSAGDETISADHLADLCGSINYEVVSRINPLIPRLVI